MATTKSGQMATAPTRTEMKLKAQDVLMRGIANALGYYGELDTLEAAFKDSPEFNEIIHREADRVAKLFGYDRAWAN